jgi:glutamine---fructose-6-phosphate transaminase (isomerizing)
LVIPYDKIQNNRSFVKMCGIFGIIASENCHVNHDFLINVMSDLFLFSESRGKEASGLAMSIGNNIHILKSGQSASALVKSTAYSKMFSYLKDDVLGQPLHTPLILMGHSRLVTNGRHSLNQNNQPVTRDGWVGIHNGIIVNDTEIWSHLSINRNTDLDTEALLALLAYHSEKKDKITAICETFRQLEGNASVALMIPKSTHFYLATNNGSLYYWADKQKGIGIFASEAFILKRVLFNCKFSSKDKSATLSHIVTNTGLCVQVNSLVEETFAWKKNDTPKILPKEIVPDQKNSQLIFDHSQPDYPNFDNLRRCVHCILPVTFPFIEFNEQGICNYCQNNSPGEAKNSEELLNLLAPYRSKNGQPDCLVGLSGGRDSTYGLHYIKTVLKMNPIAYTYDWGLVTDLARRNIARVCGKLGIEHILISADIQKKRANVRKNIHAWLKNPSLCMIPLFMAGDKQFYYYAHKLRQQTGVKLFLFCAGNDFERTEFKTGFCGLQGSSGRGILTQLSKTNKLKLALGYAKELLHNPRYINSSLLDSLSAFYASYVLRDDYVYLYHYIDWHEENIVKTLCDEYNWERATDTQTTWRIGDGTAAFYNYIYYVVAGFTEHDTFRSNQIRAGMISREEALKLAKEDNKPRWESLEWYAKTIGFNLDEALLAIHNIPRLY